MTSLQKDSSTYGRNEDIEKSPLQSHTIVANKTHKQMPKLAWRRKRTSNCLKVCPPKYLLITRRKSPFIVVRPGRSHPNISSLGHNYQ